MQTVMPAALRAVALLATVVAATSAIAATVNLTYLEGQIPIAADAVAAHGPDLFGDKVNMYNGSLTFEQTDLSLPGNSALPVTLARRHTPGRDYGIVGPFGDWDLDVPRMSGSYAGAAGWTGGAYPPNQSRCTQFAAPPSVTSSGTSVSFIASDYWNGHYLHVPGHGSQEILRRAGGNGQAPQDGNSYPLVTHRNWQIGCLSALRNGAGEGFFAVSPDGDRYRFDWLATRTVDAVTKLGGTIGRQEIFIHATEVTDRFGNWVRYSYNPASPMQLQRIESSDGRVITLSYAGDRITAASDGTKALIYSYSHYGGIAHLSGIQLPDGSRWTFNLFGMIYGNTSVLGEGANCDFPGGGWPANGMVGTMTHPSGATARFEMGFVMHGTHSVLKSCKYPPGNTVKPYGAVYPKNSTTQSLLTKTMTGPGLAPLTWTYGYQGGSSWSDCTNCPDRKTNRVTNPAGHVTRYTYGNRWRVSEGQLLATDGTSGGTETPTVRSALSPIPYGSIDYLPNALGQPTQVSGYAYNVSHHPNGAVAGYTLTNGITHTVNLNTCGLPQRWQDSGVTNDQYSYDANANIIGIADHQQGLASRSMGYDGLDRLTQANGLWALEASPTTRLTICDAASSAVLTYGTTTITPTACKA